MRLKLSDNSGHINLEIGDNIVVSGDVSFGYEFPFGRPDTEETKPRLGDKRLCQKRKFDKTRVGKVTGVKYMSTGTLSCYNEGGYEEPEYSVRYLKDVVRHTCVCYKTSLNGREQLALLDQIIKIEEPSCQKTI